jgi:hypothetical protein
MRTPPTSLQYFFKGKPLQPVRNNNYSQVEKIEIINQLWSDYHAGMLKSDILVIIVLDKLFPIYTAQLILNDMMEKKILKKNPFTNTTNLIFKKKGIFEW